MGIPTTIEFDQAIAEAARMRESGEDPNHIAKTLLSLNYRFQHLKEVYHATEHYLNSGMAEIPHAKLTVALRKFRELENESGDSDRLPM
jgi:hypothetical protein